MSFYKSFISISIFFVSVSYGKELTSKEIDDILGRHENVPAQRPRYQDLVTPAAPGPDALGKTNRHKYTEIETPGGISNNRDYDYENPNSRSGPIPPSLHQNGFNAQGYSNIQYERDHFYIDKK